MAVANPAELSAYIISFAGAARTAQGIMSSGADPMTIAEYTFEINITADFDIGSETNVKLNVWRLNIQQKVTVEYKNHWGITIKCTIKPAAVLAGA